ALVEPSCFHEAVPREEMEAGHPAQEVVVSVEAVGRLSPGALDLRALEPWLDRPNDTCGHAILQLKHVFESAVEAIRPDVTARHRIDELPGDAHARPRLAHAAFKHVAHPKLARHLLHVHGAALVSEAGIAGDDEQPADA